MNFTRSSRRTMGLPAIMAAAVTLIVAAGCGDNGADDAAPQSDVAAMARADIEQGSPIDEPFRYAEADADDLAQFNALIERRENPPFQIGETRFDADLGAIVLTNISNTEGGRVFTVGRAELYGVDFEYLGALGTDDEIAARREVIRKARLFDITLAGYKDLSFDGEITIEAMELDQLVLDTRTTRREGDDPSGVALAGLFMKNAVIEATGGEGQDVDLTLADMRLNDVTRGRFGGLSMQGLDYTITQDREAVLAALEVEGVSLPGGRDGLISQMTIPAEQRMTIAMLTWGETDVSGLLDWTDQGMMPPASEDDLLSIGAVEMTDSLVYVNDTLASSTGYTAVDPIAFDWLIPLNIRMVSRDVTTDLGAYAAEGNRALNAAIETHGLDNLQAEAIGEWRYDPETKNAALAYDLTMADQGRVTVAYQLAGLDAETLLPVMADLNPMPLASLALGEFRLQIEDEGLVDAITAIAAAETDQDAQVLRDSLPALLGLGSSQLAAAVPQVETYVAETNRFLADGGTLTVAMEPEQPVAFLALFVTTQISPQALPEALGLSVTHTED